MGPGHRILGLSKKKPAGLVCLCFGRRQHPAQPGGLVYNELFPVGFVIAALHLLALALQVYALAQRKMAAR